MDKSLNDFHPAVFFENVFPQVRCSISVRILRIAFAIVRAFVKREPVGFTPFQFRTHEYFILINGKVYKTSFFESKERLPIVSCGAVLFKGVACILTRELIFQFHCSKWNSVKGYDNEIKILVAFSGKVIDDDVPQGVSEPEITGYSEKELPSAFEKEEYKILIVADKYQTGFDQPLLHTMYVDKKLSGVKAVQTLSRLNRTCPGKEDTFVLDFANDRQTILDSFQPYYEVTSVTEETDINHLYDLKAILDQFQVYWGQEIEAFSNVYFDPKTKLNNPKQQKHLYAFTDPAVDRYRAITEEEKQDEFKKGLRSWTNLYAFLSQIMPFIDSEFEKFYAYAKLLQTRLPKRELSESLHLDDEVALEYYRLQKIKEGSIELQKGDEGELSGTSEAGLKRAKDEEALLSEIINVLNDRFGTEFEEADKLFFDQIEAELMEDETLQTQARVNKIDTFKFAFNDKFIDKLIGRMDQNQDIFEKILEDKVFGDLVKELMMKKIYKKLNE
jgi:type I restriction enzyme R subunit